MHAARPAVIPPAPGPIRLDPAVGRHPLVARLRRSLEDRCGVRSGERVVVGVSGGADSMALLVALAVLRGRGATADYHVDVSAVHVHHHLRDDADDDAAAVERWCAGLGIDLALVHVHPAREAGNRAAAARALRYRALCERAKAVGSRRIVVAHHAEDQFETILMALCRGAGLDGLGGMDWCRPLVEGVQLVRPLLDTRRAECEELCRAAGIEWRRDPSNDDPSQVRARLRRDVLPVLESIWPDAARRAVGAADTLKAARDALDESLAKHFGDPARSAWSRETLAGLPASMIAAGLRRTAMWLAPDVADRLTRRQLLEAADAIRDGRRQPRSFDWPGGLVLRVDVRGVELVKP